MRFRSAQTWSTAKAQIDSMKQTAGLTINVSGFQTLSVLESVFFHAIFHPLCQNKYRNIGFITEKGVKGLRHSVSFFALKTGRLECLCLLLMFTDSQ